MDEKDKKIFKKTVSLAVMAAYPLVVCEWQRMPLSSNPQLLKILADIRLIVAYGENHPAILESIRVIKTNECSCKSRIAVEKASYLKKLIVDSISSACPHLEGIWIKNPNETNIDFKNKLNNIICILNYASQHPKFLQSLQKGKIQ